MDLLIDGLGEPFGDYSALPVYMLCRQARPYVKVALSGDGGDEIFLGYTGLMNQRLARRLRLAPAAVRRMGAELVAGRQADVPRRLNKYLNLSLLDDAGIIIEWCRRWDWSELDALLGANLREQLFPCKSELFPEVRAMIRPEETGGFVDQQIRFHMLVDLPCDILFKADRMSMAHGLEVRVPMLANGMLEYGAQLPLAMRARGGRSKEPLRTLAETLSPTMARPSPKHGFGFPLDLWIRGKIGQYWHDWEITSILQRVGFQSAELNRMVTSYSQTGPVGQTYNTRSLSAHLFDLMLLAIWMDNHHIQI
jgi:asparagine synthase (glutamine-hydrolysing)